MGTRALIHIRESGKVLTTLYIHWDGYPTGLGADILEHLKDHRILSGYSCGDDITNAFNGMGCLAAYLIHELKTGIGGVYIHPAGSGAGPCIEFVYTIYQKGEFIFLKVVSCSMSRDDQPLYNGSLNGYIPKDLEDENGDY